MDLPISALPNANLPLGGAELFAVVQGGQTKSVSFSNMVNSGVYISTDSCQSCSQSASLEADGPPVNSMVDITVVVNVISMTTFDNMGIQATWNNGTVQTADGPVVGNTAGTPPSNLTVASTSGGFQLIPSSSCTFTFTQRTIISASQPVYASIATGGAFLGLFDAFLVVNNVVPLPYV